MTVTVTPDAEALVAQYLLAQPELTALTTRVGGRTPSTLDQPWVRITQIGDTPQSNLPIVHLVAVHLQIDCYGSSDRDAMHAEASLIARTVRGLLDRMTTTSHVSAVKFTSLMRLPDTAIEPARERFILDTDIYLHP